MEPAEKVYRSRGKMLLDNFLGGIVWALGVWVGSAVIIALLVYFISKIDFVPIIGNFMASISDYLVKKNAPFSF